MQLSNIIALHKARKLDEAEMACREFFAGNPFSAHACSLLGAIRRDRGDRAEALALMRRAVAMAPAVSAARVNLAALLGETGHPQEAIEQLKEALRLGPAIPELHNNLGAALEKLGRLKEAAAAYHQAVRLRHDYPEAHCNFANTLRKMGQISSAGAEYHEALRQRPDYEKIYGGLADVAIEMGDARKAIACYRKLAEIRPDWPNPRSSLLYNLHYCPEYSPDELSAEHMEWDRRFGQPLKDKIRPHENDLNPDRRLRVGYVSPDFREQAVAHFAVPLLVNQDSETVEVFCYSDAAVPDATTARLRDHVGHWRDSHSLNDEQLGARIREDRIDILIDLRGHAAGNRLMLFARKPAPVQANMIGYFDTTGLAAMDYRITDWFQDPEGETERYHSETLVRLDPSCWCYTPGEDTPDIATPPAELNGHVTFGSLNKIVKASDHCVRLWARVLEAVPKSMLVLSVAEADATGAVRERLAACGIASKRVDILDKTPTRREYLARFNSIDIALDTWPFNGITTTCDGLWMGVPTVSMSGDTSVSRAGRSILHAAGLSELATDDPDTYVRSAAALASDVARLRTLRREMRDRLMASPLMDQRGYAARLESAYRQMWRTRCGGIRGVAVASNRRAEVPTLANCSYSSCS